MRFSITFSEKDGDLSLSGCSLIYHLHFALLLLLVSYFPNLKKCKLSIN